MNDPHVTALHYWVNHDDSVDYAEADALEYENELFHLEANGRKVVIAPKGHYASEEEARAAFESFIRHWEFEAALESGSKQQVFAGLHGGRRGRPQSATVTPRDGTD